ncbi:MAG: methyltransferase domain-containing protein, partial [Myxococcales bacterium]
MANVSTDNLGFVECWNDILTPKWIRFRHLLSGNGKVHSDLAFPDFGIEEGDKVLDIGCGFGETALEIAEMVGPSGEVVGIDCTDAFLDVAEREREAAALANVRFELGDAQICDLPEGYFDV